METTRQHDSLKHVTLSWKHNFINFLFDQILARCRLLLWPFHFITKLWQFFNSAIWLLSNEYCKSTLGACGDGVRIYGRFYLTAPSKLFIGHNVHINANAFLRTEGGLYIGNNVHIGRNLAIYTVNHNYKGQCLPYDADMILKPVKIEDNVWIGINVTLVPGITIGEGAIIGMGSVVTQDVPPLAIVGSPSPRVLKHRDQLQYEKLNTLKHYGGMSGFLWKQTRK